MIQPDVVALVERLVRYLDEPLADVSIFPTYLVSQLARQHVTVVLSGDGGDELLAGYDWYLADRLARYYGLLPAALRHHWLPYVMARIPPTPRKKGLINRLKRFVDGAVLPEALQHFRWNLFMTEEAKRHLYTEHLQAAVGPVDGSARLIAHLQTAEGDRLWQQQQADIRTFLVDDILVKVDRMSMANALEVRTPFLDYWVVEFAARLPGHLKLRGWQTKRLLKQCMADKLPREVLTRGKEGFSIPIKNWLRQELRPLMQDVLSPAKLRREGLFNTTYVEKLKADHLSGIANHSHQLWSLIMFEIWYDTYLT